MSSRNIKAQRAAKEALRCGIEELGPDFEDEQDLEHMYARELFEHEQRAQQQEQQR
jgi:hypothetical protein